jgi:hypothetical protein
LSTKKIDVFAPIFVGDFFGGERPSLNDDRYLVPIAAISTPHRSHIPGTS